MKNFFYLLVMLTSLISITHAQIIPAGDPIIGTDGSMLFNGNFSQKDINLHPLRWEVSGSKFVTNALDAVVSQDFNHGIEQSAASLKVMDNDAANYTLVRSERRLVQAGTTYQVRAWCKGSTGTIARLYIEYWDVNKAKISEYTVDPAFSTSWTLYSRTLLAPSGAIHCTVAIYSLTASIGVSYWDDISLVQTTPTYNSTVATNVRELFIDDYRLESCFEVARQVNPGTKSAPLLWKTQGWESDFFYFTGTVLKDQPAGSGYRMWYYSGGHTCYATSTDGITWVKPNLGSYSIPTYGTANNIAFPPGEGQGLTVVYDAADPDPNKRYKGMVCKTPTSLGYFIYYSPTGTSNWTIGNGGLEVLPYGDVSNMTSDGTKFIATTKQRTLYSGTSASFFYDRMAFISTSTNSTTWTAPGYATDLFTPICEGDQADDAYAQSKRNIEAQVYGMSVYPYESTYIGVPWMFYINNYSVGMNASTGDGPIEAQVMSSRDLRTWGRPNRDPIIPIGKAGSWDDGCIFTASTMQTTAIDHTIYYGGTNMPHGFNTTAPLQNTVGKIAKATWRRDGFVSLHNEGNDEGYVITKLVHFSGATTLKVNAKMFTDGTLKVEALNSSGTPIAGFTYATATAVSGDQMSATVSWTAGSNISSLANTDIKLKFYIKGGDVYSYWFQ